MEYLSHFQPKSGSVPLHVGIIPDGTRRWSKAHSTSLLDGYRHAMRRIGDCLEHLFLGDTRSVSVYLCSVQNVQRRDSEELSALFQAESELCREILPPIMARFHTRVTVAGDTSILPLAFADALGSIANDSCYETQSHLYLCAAYCPLRELEAARRDASQQDLWMSHLWVPEPLDLVIRTGGANLLSSFLPLQSGFARIYVLPQLFNDLSLIDIDRILHAFRYIGRKYGE